METKLTTSKRLFTLFLALAIITLIPLSSAPANLAGFHTLCSFAPISTIYLLGASMFFYDRVKRIKAWMMRQELKRLAASEKFAA
jgi:hypothetical protein